MNCYIRDKSENPTNGIYKIVNSITKKVYIGRSGDIEARWKEHKKDLKKKKHYNKELQQCCYEFFIGDSIKATK